MTKNKILELLKTNEHLTVQELTKLIGVSRQTIHSNLNLLLNEKLISKIGKSPKVVYRINKQINSLNLENLTPEEVNSLELKFSELTISGELLKGVPAFENWLIRTGQQKQYKKLAEIYIESLKKYYPDQDYLSLKNKIDLTFEKVFIDDLFCFDFYSIPQFGKTYIGNLITAAKSGQDLKSIISLSELFNLHIEKIIKKLNIDAVCWTPHSIPRELLFLREIKKRSSLNLPEIGIRKIFKNTIPVAQKSLSKLSDRVENASETIFIENRPIGYKKILVIDDAVGSGSTINEIARKIKNQSISNNKIYGLAFAGSFKGYDVISIV